MGGGRKEEEEVFPDLIFTKVRVEEEEEGRELEHIWCFANFPISIYRNPKGKKKILYSIGGTQIF